MAEFGNLLSALPQPLTVELVDQLIGRPGLRIERIVSQGQASPEGFWYDQDEHEWVLLLQGAARLRSEDATIDLKAGDWRHIPAHQKHRVEWSDPAQTTIWLAVFWRE